MLMKHAQEIIVRNFPHLQDRLAELAVDKSDYPPRPCKHCDGEQYLVGRPKLPQGRVSMGGFGICYKCGACDSV